MGVNPYTAVSLAETWRAVPGRFPYEVSDQGRVRRVSGGSHTQAGRVVHHHRSDVGPKVRLTRMAEIDGERVQLERPWLVHRLVWTVFVGPITRLEVVKPRNGNVFDTRLCNLVLSRRWSRVGGLGSEGQP